MTKHLPLIALTAVMLAACGGSDKNASDKAGQAGNQNVLRIYNWSEYVDPETVADFEKKNGIKVTYDVYDSDETLESKVLTGKSGYDIVGPSNTFVGRQIKAGAYQKIDKSLIPNYKKPQSRTDEADGRRRSEPRIRRSVLLGNEYLRHQYRAREKSLRHGQTAGQPMGLVFNPEYTSKLKQCGISYLDSAAEIYPMVLNYMGKNPNSNDTEDIKAATELLKKNRPNIKRFTSSGFIDDLARGDTCVTIGFGGDLNIARRRAEEAGGKEKIRVMMPKEGVGIWVDSFVIPKDAKNVANAHKYINDFLDPEVAARNGNFVTYAPSSKPARELMEAEFRDDRTIFPSEEDLKNSFIMVPIQPTILKFMVRQWQGVKAGK